MKTIAVIVALGIIPTVGGCGVPKAETERTLTAVGHASLLVAPDRVKMKAAVVTEDATPVLALQANNGLMTAVYDAIRRLGIPQENVETSEVSVEPIDPNQYGAHPPPGPRMVRYHVENNVTVKIDDLSTIADVMGALVTAGANQIRDVNFEVKDGERYYAMARAAAIKDSLVRAKSMADAAGVRLGPVIRIGTGGQTFNEEIPETVLITGSLIRSTTRVPVTPGKKEIKADIAVVYRIS
jgi:uncharacterized protein